MKTKRVVCVEVPVIEGSVILLISRSATKETVRTDCVLARVVIDRDYRSA
jgi:dUTPase